MRAMKRAALIVASLVALLAYPAWTVIGRARSEQMGSVCGSHMTGLAHALAMYCDRYDGVAPPAAHWSDAILPYVEGGRESFSCPAAKNRVCSYAMNEAAGGRRLSALADASSFVVLFESDAGWNAAGGPELLPPSPRHHGRYDRVSFGTSASSYALRDYQVTGSGKGWLRGFRGDLSWVPQPPRHKTK